jgi:hypothetical protein
MDNAALMLGRILFVVGGSLLATALIAFSLWLACIAWTMFSVTFRKICQAESLIRDYRKNREKFLEWREGEENMWKGRMEDLYGK